ncbi:MAG TPA: SDR family NAD(P)-dependent oxidoreductase [Gemmataceae bacterium]|nr:SDR family NAD(P)-dependent oxidoreductase [Gemmataceae bacterium]
MSNLKDRAVLITGGGSGIGLAAARLFLEQGARVAISGRNADKLRQAAESLGAGRVLHHAADVSDPAQVRALADRVLRAFGALDVLVNNAGINIKGRALREMTPESWQQLVRTNLDGAFYCVHAFLPHMRERRQGLIININSISGKRANPLGGIAYNAAKFGLTGMATSLAAEEKANGIRVSSIFPGEVNTPILNERPQPVAEEHLKAILQPEDVAAAILFVASLPPHVSVPELVITPSHYAYI